MKDHELARLRDAFSHGCVSAWLGYGDVLFLGFGEHIVPRGRAGERHPRPPYELESNFSAWRVDGPVSAAWEDDSSPTAAAAESLVGERVLSWELLDGLGLRLVFSGGKVLVVEPWAPSEGISDAWSLTAPDGLILAVSTDGRTVVVPADQPTSAWFP